MTTRNRVGLGTFPLANVFASVDKEKGKEVVRTFLDNGGYYIDTAPMYGFGEVEVLLGEVLSDYQRDKFYLATKCGYIDVEGKTFQTIQKSGKYDDVLRECDRSLQRLKLEYIDLYFVHSPDPNTPFEETMRALIKLQKDGKIKEIGVSNVNLEELKEYNKSGVVKYIQNRFSLVNRSIEPELEKYMLEKDIKLVPYQVIDRGQLSDRALTGLNLRQEDLRNGRSDWLDEQLNVITSWVKEKLGPVSKELGVSIEQLAMAWALHQKYMGFLIVGATDTNQVKANLQADKVKFTPDQLTDIDSDYRELEQEIRGKYHQTIREFRGLNAKYY